MTEKETMLRSVLFLVIGILLLLSLIVCIFLVGRESDLVKINASVIDVKKDVDGTGKNNVKIAYNVDGTVYNYNFETKKDLNVDDEYVIYYHKKKVNSVQDYKTSKLIFICPIIGLILCGIGLYELFLKKKDDTDLFNTSVIGVVGNTQQLKIVTGDIPEVPYVKTPEEQNEVSVKAIKKTVEEVTSAPIPAPIELPTIKEESVAPVTPVTPVVPVAAPAAPVVQPAVTPAASAPVAPVAPAPVTPAPVKAPEPASVAPAPASTPAPVKQEQTLEAAVSAPIPAPSKSKTADKVQEEVLKKVKGNGKIEVNEEQLKEAIKDVLQEVIKEVKEEKKPKKVVQQKVIPNYYYISGSTLIFEEPGKDGKELNLKDIKNVIRTVNSEGAVVKLVVESDAYKCVLTNMKNIDLEQVADLLHNKLRAMDDSFNETIEHKEY